MSTVEGCGDPERIDFYHLLLCKSGMVLRSKLNMSCFGRGGGPERHNFNSFYFVRMWWSLKN